MLYNSEKGIWKVIFFVNSFEQVLRKVDKIAIGGLIGAKRPNWQFYESDLLELYERLKLIETCLKHLVYTIDNHIEYLEASLSVL